MCTEMDVCVPTLPEHKIFPRPCVLCSVSDCVLGNSVTLFGVLCTVCAAVTEKQACGVEYQVALRPVKALVLYRVPCGWHYCANVCVSCWEQHLQQMYTVCKWAIAWPFVMLQVRALAQYHMCHVYISYGVTAKTVLRKSTCKYSIMCLFLC